MERIEEKNIENVIFDSFIFYKWKLDLKNYG